MASLIFDGISFMCYLFSWALQTRRDVTPGLYSSLEILQVPPECEWIFSQCLVQIIVIVTFMYLMML